MVKMWELGHESFHFDRAVYIASKMMKDLNLSRNETMYSVIYMAKAIAKMISASEERASKFIEERGLFN